MFAECAMRNYLPIVALLLIWSTSSAQLDNRFISDEINIKQSDSNTVGLSVNAFNYMRNTEYFNDMEWGRTLFGYQLNPSVYLQPNKNLRIQTGIFVRNDFGGYNPYTFATPTFSVKVGRERGPQFIFGTLEGALAHRLIEPLFDINSAIEKRIENGFQVKGEHEKVFYDVWINWEKFIERGSPFKEQFTYGLNIQTAVFKSENGFRLDLAVQNLLYHRGGQIDADTSNMVLQENGAAGLVLSKKQNAFVKEIRADAYALIYREATNSGYFPYRGGAGVYGNLLFATRWLDMMFSYWQGNSFISPKGSPLYQSVSLDKFPLTEKNRQLLLIRFMYQKQVYENLFLVARIEPVYDLRNSMLDYSYSFYLSYRQDITLGRLRKPQASALR